MARVTVPINAADLENTQAAEVRVSYGGPLPPIDVYRVRVSRIKYKQNRNDDWYYEVTLVIAHDDSEPKSKFNGYMRSTNLTFSDQGLKFVKQWGEAAGFSTAEILHPYLDDDGETVTHIGKKPATGYKLRTSFKQGKPYEGKKTLDIGSFMPDAPDAGKAGFVRDEEDEFDVNADDDAFASDSNGDIDGIGTDEFTDDSFEDDGPAALEGDGYDDSGMDEFADDEPEPAPAPRRAAPAKKAAPAKATARRTTPY